MTDEKRGSNTAEDRSRIPKDRGYALLHVLLRGILWTRNGIPLVHGQQICDLMDAMHNIPIYLQHGGEDFWATIQFDLDRYDEKYASCTHGKLKQIFQDGLQEYQSSSCEYEAP